ncbi:uncharacterized protein [Drosophila pseudoobscura]|uniref:C-type lectin domain-containing protein n=1 Tax=Drosophila pseudoobscura pseudoobscura TaxID=46245 RepID=A0A6I8V5K3_DROPS|nr:uncharacterized protein LOC6898459 [Drosophila pseudoobscura]
MDLQVKRLTFCLSIFVCIWNWQIGEVNSSGCHYFSTDKRDWFDALTSCQRLSMCLADVSTAQTFQEIESKLLDREEYWFGLNGYEKITFKYVSSNQPQNYVPPQSQLSLSTACGYLKPLGPDAYAISTASCGQLKRFVCTPTVKCNGLETNSSFISNFPTEVPCQLSPEVSTILGI